VQNLNPQSLNTSGSQTVFRFGSSGLGSEVAEAKKEKKQRVSPATKLKRINKKFKEEIRVYVHSGSNDPNKEYSDSEPSEAPMKKDSEPEAK
ncbi:hypothetical protein A2U01_0000036, partial [Trifolium medium]|nr:hypothetical protein [Trifolium medium]